VVIASFNINGTGVGFIYEPRQQRLWIIIVVSSVFYFIFRPPTRKTTIDYINKQDGL